MTRRRTVEALRESIERLTEIFAGSSYAGPEPGKEWNLDMGPQGGGMAIAAFQDLVQAQRMAQSKRVKDKERENNRDKRAELRKLALWLQKRKP